MRLILPLINDKGTENVLDLPTTDFGFDPITNELIHSSPLPDVILKGVDKFFVSFDAASVSNQRVSPNKELCCHGSIVDNRSVRKDRVSGNGLLAS
jgi:hypothetical protein